jgi:hypothetical protein
VLIGGVWIGGGSSSQSLVPGGNVGAPLSGAAQLGSLVRGSRDRAT